MPDLNGMQIEQGDVHIGLVYETHHLPELLGPADVQDRDGSRKAF